MYLLLCEDLTARRVYTVCDYLLNKPDTAVILRHDVDVSAEKALRMAKLERKVGVKSTYYFRYPKTFNPKIMKEIESMGHEVGYHYEVLDKAKGDHEQAIRLFGQELAEFRKHVDVKTISMHGGVLTKYDNRDLWKKHDFKDFGIIGEAYLSLDFNKIKYFTDTGRDWSGRYSIKDNTGVVGHREGIKNTCDLIRMLEDEKHQLICITTHPKRWSDNYLEWSWEFILQSLKNTGKKCLLRR